MRTRLAIALLLMAPMMAMAQRVSGIVRATGTLAPMSEVTITVLDSVGAAVAQGRTDDRGRYGVAIEPDARQVRATRIGYRPVTLAIIRGSGDATVDIVMDVFRELDTVVTKAPEQRYNVPRLQDFEKRRLSGMGGHFISEDDLRKHDGRSIADIIRVYVPGLRLVSDRGQTLLSSRSAPFMNAAQPSRARGAVGCWATIYLDGIMLYQNIEAKRGEPPPAPPPDINQFLAMNLSGVEYYSGGMTPLQYKDVRNPCGTLLLWTRGK